MSHETYQAELDFATELAYEAGKVMMRYFRNPELEVEWKSDNTPLTQADTTINDMVINGVRAKFPEDDVIGEEGSNEHGGLRAWVVDPIDGTLPFSNGIPVSTFSLGLVDRSDGQTVVAAIYYPFLDELYTATKGGGAHMNGAKLETAKTTDLNGVFAVLGGSNKVEANQFTQGKAVTYIREQGGKTMSMQSQAY